MSPLVCQLGAYDSGSMALIRGHFVPKFFLRRFTLGGGEDDDLFVFDQAREKTWRSSPLKAAKETGMYAGEGPDPEVMERAMAAAEGEFGRIVGDVIEKETLPTGDDWIEFLGFIAVMFVRVPKYRDRYQRARQSGSSRRTVEPARGAGPENGASQVRVSLGWIHSGGDEKLAGHGGHGVPLATQHLPIRDEPQCGSTGSNP
jgi:hypothetical protein